MSVEVSDERKRRPFGGAAFVDAVAVGVGCSLEPATVLDVHVAGLVLVLLAQPLQ